MATKRGQKSGLESLATNGKAPAPSPANAWARPLKTTGPPPGMGPPNKARAPPPTTSVGTANSNNSKGAKPAANGSPASGLPNVHRERLLHLSLTLVGLNVVATLTDGTVLEGVFSTFTPFDGLTPEMKNKYVLNAVKVTKAGTDNTIKNGTTAILPVHKVTHLSAKNVDMTRSQNGGAKGGQNDLLVTDTQISGARGGRNAELVAAGSAWTTTPVVPPGKPVPRADALAGALEDVKGTRKSFGTALKSGDTAGGGSGLQGSIGQWDQFRANQELFNVNASFDENLYTTELDKSQIDKRKIAEAERIAREIENTASTNIHIAEERGHVVETDYDEEDRYSGVLTKDGKQRHEAAEKFKTPTPPAAPAPGPVPTPVAAQVPPKKMNYAAAAAKADAANKKKVPPTPAKPQTTSIVTPEPKQQPPPPAVEAVPKVTPEPKKEPPSEQPPKQVKEESSKPVVPEETKTPDVPPPAEEKTQPPKETVEKTTSEKEESRETEVKAEDKTEPKKEDAKKSKLNANAKAFTFNPAAKSFTPSFGGGGTSYSAPQMQQPQHATDPNMQVHAGVHPMQPPHYMHATPMPAGMMPMMNPQFQGMRYPPQFAGMDQHGGVMQIQQPQHMQSQQAQPMASGSPPSSTGAPASESGAPAASEGESSAPQSQEGGSAAQPGPAAPQHPQQAVPMPYNVPPQGAYFTGGQMALHPRGPGYPPQFVGAPQQIPVGPGGGSYRPMYPMQPGAMPPNMHMRGPGGAPYYPGPNGPIPYPPNAYGGHGGMMDDGDGTFRGRGRGQGRGRGRGGRRGGRGMGRGNYQQQQYMGNQGDPSAPQPQMEGGSEQRPPENAPAPSTNGEAAS